MLTVDAPRSSLSDAPKIIIIGSWERKLRSIYWFENAPRGDPCCSHRCLESGWHMELPIEARGAIVERRADWSVLGTYRKDAGDD